MDKITSWWKGNKEEPLFVFFHYLALLGMVLFLSTLILAQVWTTYEKLFHISAGIGLIVVCICVLAISIEISKDR